MNTDQIKFLNTHEWGGSGIERVTFEYILSIVPEGGKILELGAGFCSTPAFKMFYDLTSVDHNAEYLIHNKEKGIFAKYNERDKWYDVKTLKKHLTNDYDLILLDGINREGFLHHIKLFKNIKNIIIHDTYREIEKDLAIRIATKLNRQIYFHTEGDYFAHIW